MAFQGCEKCKAEQGKPAGYIRQVDPSTHQIYLVECDCHKKYIKRLQDDALIRNSAIPSLILDYDIDRDYKGSKSKQSVENIKKLSQKFASDPRFHRAMYYIYGPNGTQKTTVMQWLVLSLLEQNVSAAFTTMQEALQNIAVAIPTEKSQQYLTALEDVDFLVLDESFDRSKVTIFKSGFQIPYLDSTLRNRLGRGKATAFISNIAVEDIDDMIFGTSIKDLVKRETTIQKTQLPFMDNYLNEYSRYDSSKGLF